MASATCAQDLGGFDGASITNLHTDPSVNDLASPFSDATTTPRSKRHSGMHRQPRVHRWRARTSLGSPKDQSTG